EILIEGTPSAAFAAAVEKDELTAELLEHDFGRVAVVARLVGPFARLDLSLEIDFRTFFQIALRDPAEILVEDHDIVPLGPLLAVPVAVLPLLGGGDAHVDDLAAVIERTRLRIRAQIADQDHLVHARHATLLFLEDSYRPSATAVQ